MNIGEVTEKVCDAIKSRKYDVIILNFANPDMVGHTGNLEAAIKAVEAVDNSVGKVVELIEKNKDNLIITSDHGNIEKMIDNTKGEPSTAHSTNPVPFILITEEYKKIKDGKLADIAPTMLELMNLEKPVDMTGESLIISK
jgi:2,3-bisphosphoglycerate-independent phosphoglycerate mutase